MVSRIIQLFFVCHTFSLMHGLEFLHFGMNLSEGIILHLAIENNQSHQSRQLDYIQAARNIFEILRAFQLGPELHLDVD